jgi:hypothetical protein
MLDASIDARVSIDADTDLDATTDVGLPDAGPALCSALSREACAITNVLSVTQGGLTCTGRAVHPDCVDHAAPWYVQSCNRTESAAQLRPVQPTAPPWLRR